MAYSYNGTLATQTNLTNIAEPKKSQNKNHRTFAHTKVSGESQKVRNKSYFIVYSDKSQNSDYMQRMAYD